MKLNESEIQFINEFEKINEEFRITDSSIPRDGSLYDNDIKSIFPKSVRKDMEKLIIIVGPKLPHLIFLQK
mgnify:CR=1 FL=1